MHEPLSIPSSVNTTEKPPHPVNRCRRSPRERFILPARLPGVSFRVRLADRPSCSALVHGAGRAVRVCVGWSHRRVEQSALRARSSPMIGPAVTPVPRLLERTRRQVWMPRLAACGCAPPRTN
ncbi:hypothetical protein BC834DRAFT_643019 [Gloeopeniophorella convolvens]|nr:hypothetical protein BC834DRAFT_643019 [Gloeopeniophorella convolvens]